MRVVVGLAGVAVIAVILWDAFEALVLPRRVTRRLRPTRFFYASTWRLWKLGALGMRAGGRRETYLSFYAPLSLLLLLNLWAFSLVVGFALVQWALGLALKTPAAPPTIWDALYMSGSTFFTLGLGDIVPISGVARALTVAEAGMGFMFLAVMVGYLAPHTPQRSERPGGAGPLLDTPLTPRGGRRSGTCAGRRGSSRRAGW